jgi:predicted RNA binding protein YcfA (HicA-like mRNA interferase family)
VERYLWDQLKNVTPGRLIKALENDGWTLESTRGSIHLFVKAGSPLRRASIHFHCTTYGPKLLKAILADTRWDEADFVRLGLVKGRKRKAR